MSPGRWQGQVFGSPGDIRPDAPGACGATTKGLAADRGRTYRGNALVAPCRPVAACYAWGLHVEARGPARPRASLVRGKRARARAASWRRRRSTPSGPRGRASIGATGTPRAGRRDRYATPDSTSSPPAVPTTRSGTAEPITATSTPAARIGRAQGVRRRSRVSVGAGPDGNAYAEVVSSPSRLTSLPCTSLPAVAGQRGWS